MFIASASATDILLLALSERIDQRRRLTRWTKSILLETLDRVHQVVFKKKNDIKVIDKAADVSKLNYKKNEDEVGQKLGGKTPKVERKEL